MESKVKYLMGISLAIFGLIGCASKDGGPSAEESESAAKASNPDASSGVNPDATSGGVNGFGDLKLIRSNELTASFLVRDLDQKHLYAIGMPEGLDQELLILDGERFGANFSNFQYNVKAPSDDLKASFLVYANVKNWKKIILANTVKTFSDLEAALPDILARAGIDPNVTTAFRLEAGVDGLKWFVVNGMGNGVPDYQSSFFRSRFLGGLDQTSIEGFGIYSPDKQGTWTSPTTKIHLHFKTKDSKSFVGHLDNEIFMKEGAAVYVPAAATDG